MDSLSMTAASLSETTGGVGSTPSVVAIGKEEVQKALEVLKKYKSGKAQLESKIQKNDRWWKIRHWDLMADGAGTDDPKPASAWLFNTIISKHADYMDSFPSADILPREESDMEESQRLSSIIPVVLDQNKFKQTYSDEAWYKLKNGTGVFGIFWDNNKLNGLGDISVKSMDLMSLFWEPGVKDIQESQNFFSVELVDNAVLEQKYPQVRGLLKSSSDTLITKYTHDDNISTENKSAVVDWYYKKKIGSRDVLHYVKFVNDIVLYATENDTEVPMKTVNQPLLNENGQITLDKFGQPISQPVQVPAGKSMAEKGLYDHGKYPFVFDALFPEVDMPTGLGFIDICKNPQASIDIYNNCMEKNFQYVCSPRYFNRMMVASMKRNSLIRIILWFTLTEIWVRTVSDR